MTHQDDDTLIDFSNDLADSEESLHLNSPADLEGAWAVAASSADPAPTLDRIVRIAFDRGWQASLPKAAREWIGRPGSSFVGDPKLSDVATGSVFDRAAFGGVLTPQIENDDNADGEKTDDNEIILPAAALAALGRPGLGSGTPL